MEMRTLAVVGGLSKTGGGTSYSVPSWSNALARHNVRRTIVTVKIKDEEICDFVDTNLVRLKMIPGFKTRILNLQWSFGFGKILKEICGKEKIELIHNHGVWLQVNHAAADVASNLKIPQIITPHGMLTLWHFNHKAWKKRLAWWFYQKKDLEKARVVHVTAQNEADDLRSIGFRKQLAIIPNGISVPEWREPRPAKLGIRTALFLSRLHLKKGLLNLVEAWAIAKPKGWQMMIVGPDDEGYGKVVRKAIADKGLEEDFVFKNPVYGEEKWDLYRNSDLFILPTFSENFGVVVPEALACGVPVITTQGTPWAELKSRSCGWWIPIGVEPLTKAIIEAMEIGDQERNKMGLRGRSLVEEKYTWDSVGAQMKELYEWILGGGRTPSFIRTD